MNAMHLFGNMLDQTFPAVRSCWDREAEGIRHDRVKRILEVGSSGERHMMLFFGDVWSGGGQREQKFDGIEAIRVIDASQAQIVLKWLNAPFWPQHYSVLETISKNTLRTDPKIQFTTRPRRKQESSSQYFRQPK